MKMFDVCSAAGIIQLLDAQLSIVLESPGNSLHSDDVAPLTEVTAALGARLQDLDRRRLIFSVNAQRDEAKDEIKTKMTALCNTMRTKNTPLWKAAREGHEAVVAHLISRGASVQANGGGRTHMATSVSYGFKVQVPR